MSQTKQRIGFIGCGIMGEPMARHLLDAGYPLAVYNRTASKCDALVAAGARRADSPADIACDADVVITMVGYPEDVEDLYLASGGLLEAAKPGSYLIDMSTSSPEMARDIASVAEVSDLHAFDAPVTGGEAGAKAATLTIMCGATEEEIEPVRGILETLGSRIVACGEHGSGQITKLANQTALAGCMVGLVEALSLAEASGLDPAQTLNVIASGAAGSAAATTLGPKILEDDFAPGFMVDHFVKDLGLVLELAEDEELTLPGVENADQLYSLLAEIGGGHMGTQALALAYADEPTCAAHGLDWSRLDMDEDDDDDDFEGADHEDDTYGCYDEPDDLDFEGILSERFDEN